MSLLTSAFAADRRPKGLQFTAVAHMRSHGFSWMPAPIVTASRRVQESSVEEGIQDEAVEALSLH
jgi:hypothetical protein